MSSSPWPATVCFLLTAWMPGSGVLAFYADRPSSQLVSTILSQVAVNGKSNCLLVNEQNLIFEHSLDIPQIMVTGQAFPDLRYKRLFVEVPCVVFLAGSVASARRLSSHCTRPLDCMILLTLQDAADSQLAEAVQLLSRPSGLSRPTVKSVVGNMVGESGTARIYKVCHHCLDVFTFVGLWGRPDRLTMRSRTDVECCDVLRNRLVKGITFALSNNSMNTYPGMEMINGRLKTTIRGPVYSLWYYLANALGFDIDFENTINIRKFFIKLLTGQVDLIPWGANDFIRINSSTIGYGIMQVYLLSEKLAPDYRVVCTFPEQKSKIYNLVLPFTKNMWIVSGCSVLFATLIMCAVTYVDKKETVNIFSSLEAAWGIIFAEPLADKWFETWPRRFISFSWVILVFVLIMAFLCNLRSSLIKPQYEKPVEDIEQLTYNTTLIISTLKSTRLAFPELENLYKKLESEGRIIFMDPGNRTLSQRVNKSACVISTYSRVMKENKILILKKERPKLRRGKGQFGDSSRRNVWFVQRENIIFDKIRKAINWAWAFGLPRKFVQLHSVSPVEPPKDNDLPPLGIDHFSLTLLSLLIGLTISICAFITELFKKIF